MSSDGTLVVFSDDVTTHCAVAVPREGQGGVTGQETQIPTPDAQWPTTLISIFDFSESMLDLWQKHDVQ